MSSNYMKGKKTPEIKVGRIMVRGQSGEIVLETPSPK
jgi:hypothetical protein